MPCPRMRFGKYRGQSLRTIPLPYLLWLLHGVQSLDGRLCQQTKAGVLRRVGTAEERAKAGRPRAGNGAGRVRPTQGGNGVDEQRRRAARALREE
jgi:hypothetical protein